MSAPSALLRPQLLAMTLCTFACLLSFARSADQPDAAPIHPDWHPRLAALESALAALPAPSDPAFAALRPDVEVLPWSLRFAFDRNLVTPKDAELIERLFTEAEARLAAFGAGQAPWLQARGRVLRAYRSRLDDTPQPYVIFPPDNSGAEAPGHTYPLRLTLPHGGIQHTLAFLAVALSSSPFRSPDSYHLYVATRGHTGAKFAGETAFWETLAHATAAYPIDPRRISLQGHSNGGSCVWHLAAHYPDRWAAASPGAGYTDYENFNRTDLDATPPLPLHTQLNRIYNTNPIAANLALLPTLAYVGDRDTHRYSHDRLAEDAARQGYLLPRLVARDTGHEYDQASTEAVNAFLGAHLAAGLATPPDRIHFSATTLRHGSAFWVGFDRLAQPLGLATIQAHFTGPNRLQIQTAGLEAFSLDFRRHPPPGFRRDQPLDLVLDGFAFTLPAADTFHFRLELNPPPAKGPRFSTWRPLGFAAAQPAGLRKQRHLAGPIDDAFTERFIFVLPTGNPTHPQHAGWLRQAAEQARENWRRKYQGEVIIKRDTEVGPADWQEANLILWGDPGSNAILARVLPGLPLAWTADTLAIGPHRADPARHLPVLIYPNPLNPARYLVINSGVTSTAPSSRLAARLPDFAFLAPDEQPDNQSGRGILHAGFFDQDWQATQTP